MRRGVALAALVAVGLFAVSSAVVPIRLSGNPSATDKKTMRALQRRESYLWEEKGRSLRAAWNVIFPPLDWRRTLL
jgi:hypothetical protein